MKRIEVQKTVWQFTEEDVLTALGHEFDLKFPKGCKLRSVSIKTEDQAREVPGFEVKAVETAETNLGAEAHLSKEES